MEDPDNILFEITPQVLLRAYCNGIFPMADSAEDTSIFWVEPELRGILPLEQFHIPRSLRKVLKKAPFDVRINTDFTQVIERCAESTIGREKTWINQQISDLCNELHDMGYAHSVEAWANGNMVGGLYGVSIGGAFFGESMFSRQTDASKICLVHLVERMKARDFILLDTQFTTRHLERFGAIEINKSEYQSLLQEAIDVDTSFI